MTAPAGIVTLSDLIDQSREESDMQHSQFVTDLAFATFISNSYKELYNLLVGAYGNDYYVAKRAQFITNGNQDLYPLPDGILPFTDETGTLAPAAPFYKLLGVDYQLSANNPQGYISLKTFPFSERNRFAVPNFASFWGFTNLRYRISGNNLWLTPIPANGQPIRLFYIPRPINLVSQLVGASTINTNTITVTDVLTPQVGMYIFGPAIQPNTTITAVGTTTITISLPAQATNANVVFKMFDYTTQVDGISGFEEYVVVDAAIKAKGKEESGVEELMVRKAALLKQIEDIAENRDPGSAAKTADVMTDIWNNGDGSNGFGGMY